jgi:hypothetical protein
VLEGEWVVKIGWLVVVVVIIGEGIVATPRLQGQEELNHVAGAARVQGWNVLEGEWIVQRLVSWWIATPRLQEQEELKHVAVAARVQGCSIARRSAIHYNF